MLFWEKLKVIKLYVIKILKERFYKYTNIIDNVKYFKTITIKRKINLFYNHAYN